MMEQPREFVCLLSRLAEKKAWILDVIAHGFSLETKCHRFHASAYHDASMGPCFCDWRVTVNPAQQPGQNFYQFINFSIYGCGDIFKKLKNFPRFQIWAIVAEHGT